MRNDFKTWLVGVATTVGLAWAAWASSSIIESIPRTEVEQRLQRIEQKLDRLIWRESNGRIQQSGD